MAAVFFRSASAPVGFAHHSPRRGAFFCGLQPFAPKCCEILSQPANALADSVCTRRFVCHALAYMPPCRRLTLGDVSEGAVWTMDWATYCPCRLIHISRRCKFFHRSEFRSIACCAVPFPRHGRPPEPHVLLTLADVDGGDEHDEHGPDIERSERAKDDCGSTRMFSNPAECEFGPQDGIGKGCAGSCYRDRRRRHASNVWSEQVVGFCFRRRGRRQ